MGEERWTYIVVGELVQVLAARDDVVGVRVAPEDLALAQEGALDEGLGGRVVLVWEADGGDVAVGDGGVDEDVAVALGEGLPFVVEGETGEVACT